MANEAAEFLEQAWEIIDRCLGAKRTSDPQDRQPAGRRRADKMAKAATQALAEPPAVKEALRRAHTTKLLQACAKVRGAPSSHLKSALLRRCALAFSTITVAGRGAVLCQHFPTVLVDETCQSCKAETLIVLRSSERRLFLLGDPRQLPAAVTSQLATRTGYSRSLFECLEALGEQPLILEEQYRMALPILAWPTWALYANRMRAAVEVLQRS